MRVFSLRRSPLSNSDWRRRPSGPIPSDNGCIYCEIYRQYSVPGFQPYELRVCYRVDSDEAGYALTLFTLIGLIGAAFQPILVRSMLLDHEPT